MGWGIGRTLIVIGLTVAAVGVLFVVGDRLGLGRLPGDLSFKRGNVRVYVPIATSIVVSVLLTVIVNLLLRGR